jgi:ADP-heptose:LPS heptosyltransferase
MPRCFLFKPDGIGDFFLASGTVRFLAREFGEENLTIAALPVIGPVVLAQFPKATFLPLPIRKKRILLNVFVANSIRCFPVWIKLLRNPQDLSISLRHMRDYLMNVLFYSVRSPRRLACENQLLGNGRPVRRLTERAFTALFHPEEIPYPAYEAGIPKELEVNRRLVSLALGRDVAIGEIWPELRRVGEAPVEGSYWVCAPFANGGGKDYPSDRWAELFRLLLRSNNIPKIILTGSTAQRERLEEFARIIKTSAPELSAGISILSPPDLQRFIDLLAGASMVLTVDTAAAHASTALDRPTVVLFSGQHHGTYGPWTRSASQRWIQPEEEFLGTREWYRNMAPEAIVPVVGEVLKTIG